MLISQLIIAPTREEGYNNQYIRGLEINATAYDVDVIAECVNSAANKTINASTVIRNTPNLASVGSMPIKVADIPNGWGITRMKMLLITSSEGPNGINYINIVQAWSEFDGDPTSSGLLDEHMLWHINSISEMVSGIDAVTGQTYYRPTGANQSVITDVSVNSPWADNMQSGLFQDAGSMLCTVDPTDVFRSMSVNALMSEAHNANHGGVTVNNTSGLLTSNKVYTANRGVSGPAVHAATTINAYMGAAVTAAMSNSTADIYSTAGQDASNALYTRDIFVTALRQAQNHRSMAPSTFTLQDLVNMDNTIIPRINYIGRAERTLGAGSIMDSTDTADTMQPTIENKIASTITQYLPGMLLESMLTYISVTIVTDQYSHEPQLHVSGYNSYLPGVNRDFGMTQLEYKLKNTLYPIISSNNMYYVEATITADLGGDTTILVSINGNPGILSRFSTFADSLTTAIITDRATREETITGYGAIMDTLHQNINSQRTGQYDRY